MPIKPPDNPVEDRLIDLLDRRVPLGRQAHELDAIRQRIAAARTRETHRGSAEDGGTKLSPLQKRDRKRLSAMLALAEAGSNSHEGERLAALNAVERRLKAEGLQLRDLAFWAPEPVHRAPLMGTWRQTCRNCLERRQSLRPWEVGFVTDLPKFQRLSAKQRYILNEIADRIGARP